MVKASEQKIYCAIDIEATGFDPLTEEILEIGFVFFRYAGNGFEVLEEWSQVFKPSKVVNSKILGLTGITEMQIASAPSLAEFHIFVQEKLQNAILVGHSVSVDVRYLEANGFKLSGQYIDTLELVQFILPTRHSYNLENLMHYFSIAHENAHRALEDARASMLLLQSLLGLFCTFPENVQRQVKEITEPFGFEWHALLSKTFHAVNILPETPEKSTSIAKLKLKIEPSTILDFKLGSNYREVILRTIAQENKAFIFATPHKNEVLDLWRKGFGAAIFAPEDTFDLEKYRKLLKERSANADVAKFLAKVIVWYGTNWQTKTILDLNLSFAGNQFRHLVAGGQNISDQAEKVFIVDHKTLLNFTQKDEAIPRNLIIEGMPEFQNQLSAKIGKKASWGGVLRILNSIYNPETTFGQTDLAKEVSDLLVATDLFFGLCVLTLERFFKEGQQVKLETLVENAKAFREIEQAAQNYASKINKFADAQKLEPLKSFAKALLSFFDSAPERVKWIEFGPRFCIFNNLPLRVEALTEKCLKVFNSTTFVDVLGPDLIGYFKSRMGLPKFSIVNIESEQSNVNNTKLVFSKETFNRKSIEKELSGHLPAAIVMPTYKEIKEFYDSNFRQLQEYAAIFAEGYSGGTNKMFYNFGLSKQSLLVLTSKLAIRSGREGVSSKTLVLDSWPKAIGGGVYFEAVKSYMERQGVNTQEVYLLEALNKVIRLFFTPNLEYVYIYKDFEAPYLERYLKMLGFLEISS